MGPVVVVDRGYDSTSQVSAPVKRAKVDANTNADFVALVAGKSLRVIFASVKFATSTTLKFQSGGSTDLTGAMTFTSLDWPWNPAGWIQTSSGEKLNGVFGSGVQLSGVIGYVEI